MKRLLSRFLPLAIATPVVAEDATRFNLGGGLTLPLADYRDVDRTGFHLDGGVNVPLGSGGLAARLDALFSRTGHDGVPGHTRIIGGMAGLAYRVSTEDSVEPYVTAAVGLKNVLGRTDLFVKASDFDTFQRRASSSRTRTVSRSRE